MATGVRAGASPRSVHCCCLTSVRRAPPPPSPPASAVRAFSFPTLQNGESCALVPRRSERRRKRGGYNYAQPSTQVYGAALSHVSVCSRERSKSTSTATLHAHARAPALLGRVAGRIPSPKTIGLAASPSLLGHPPFYFILMRAGQRLGNHDAANVFRCPHQGGALTAETAR